MIEIMGAVFKLLKTMVAFVAIYAMVFQPTIDSYTITESLNYELIDIENESDKSEENTDKDEKVHLHRINFYNNDYQLHTKLTICSSQQSKRDFVLEIPIPPPDKA